ncbi:MAG: nucleotidyltransferase family protein [Candidatus Bipolaricaulota bacterium]|nr:nucleotidyltransferase family protein [Candidatus Bipolaricaulota bacterium]MCS7275123.1 nucleotidyltransferase family protein [Candidatus Bipolaricaulota bacterium]MDW8111197.1 nucleotidyltransferase family protein [Candidatus Bipolaricaulota bacterium]MDW8329941.1 nucleotidyltransferase family protein [Candidatus Bipolaricaulota bacterium]
MVPGILLAAGAGRRFGGQKLLHEFRGRAVIYHALRAALDAPLDPVYLVLGAESERVHAALDELRASPKLRVLLNERWAWGRASSLQLALRQLPPEVPGAVVLLGDMPLMTSALIARVAKEFEKTGKLCFTIYRGEIGRPVALPRALFAEFFRLTGDESGRAILRAHWDEAIKLPLSSEEEVTQFDLDTPADGEALQRAVRP